MFKECKFLTAQAPIAAMCAIASLAHGLASHVTNYDPRFCILGITLYISNCSALVL